MRTLLRAPAIASLIAALAGCTGKELQTACISECEHAAKTFHEAAACRQRRRDAFEREGAP